MTTEPKAPTDAQLMEACKRQMGLAPTAGHCCMDDMQMVARALLTRLERERRCDGPRLKSGGTHMSPYKNGTEEY